MEEPRPMGRNLTPVTRDTEASRHIGLGNGDTCNPNFLKNNFLPGVEISSPVPWHKGRE